MTKHILYLASGTGSRFGSNKLLYTVDGKPMFRHGLETLRSVIEGRGDCRLLVVSRYEEIRRAAEEMNVRAVDSPESEKGVSYTIRAGLKALGEVSPEDYLLFVVADQPWLSAQSVDRLLAKGEEGVMGASLCWGERPGNPALFSARLLPELLALEGDTGGRAVLRRYPCAFVSAQSPRELEDIDTSSV